MSRLTECPVLRPAPCHSVRVVTNPIPRNTFLSQGSYGWSGAFGTHFWIDAKEKVVGILMTQTANQEIRPDFENAVMQSIVEPAPSGDGRTN